MRGLRTVSISLSTMCFGRRHIRIAHAEIDDVGPPGARRRLEPVDLLEDIGRQALDAVKIVCHWVNPIRNGGDARLPLPSMLPV